MNGTESVRPPWMLCGVLRVSLSSFDRTAAAEFHQLQCVAVVLIVRICRIILD